MRRFWTAVGLVFLAALTLSLVETAGLQIRYAHWGRPVPWTDSLWRPLPHWLLFAALSPLALAFAARFRVRPGRWRWIPLHVAAAFGFAMLHTALGTLAYRLILLDHAPFGAVVRGQLAFDMALELMAYAVIAAGTNAYLWFDDARRERETAVQAQAHLARARLVLLRARLQPHVLFNTLQAISALALRGDSEGVIVAIARLGDVLRAALDEDVPEEIPLARELELTDAYLEIQRLRLGDRLTIRRAIDPGALDALVPSLLLQPLVENAVQHGLGAAGAGVVNVTTERRDGTLVLGVHDDGPGVAATLREGTGLRVTRERLRALYGDRQDLVIESGRAGGTSVRVTLPYRARSEGNGRHA